MILVYDTKKSLWSSSSLEPVFKFSQNQHLNVSKKFYKKYLDVASYIHYERAKFECKIPYSLGSVKKTNWTKYERFESGTVHASRSAILSFLPRIEYLVFRDENLYTGILIRGLHSDIFSEFF
jgi:hypothetical protein